MLLVGGSVGLFLDPSRADLRSHYHVGVWGSIASFNRLIHTLTRWDGVSPRYRRRHGDARAAAPHRRGLRYVHGSALGSAWTISRDSRYAPFGTPTLSRAPPHPRTIDASYTGVYPPRAVRFFKDYHTPIVSSSGRRLAWSWSGARRRPGRHRGHRRRSHRRRLRPSAVSAPRPRRARDGRPRGRRARRRTSERAPRRVAALESFYRGRGYRLAAELLHRCRRRRGSALLDGGEALESARLAGRSSAAALLALTQAASCSSFSSRTGQRHHPVTTTSLPAS